MGDSTIVMSVLLFFGGFYLVGEVVGRLWVRFGNWYLDRHPDVERDLLRLHGKVRK